MKINKLPIILLVFSLFFGCKFISNFLKLSGNPNTQELLIRAIKLQQYDSAYIYASQNKHHVFPNSELLKQVELGSLLFLTGKYEEAHKLFVAAEYKLEDRKSFRYIDAFGGTAEIYNPFHPNYRGSTSLNAVWRTGVLTRQDSILARPAIDGLYTTYQCNNMEKPLVNFYVGLSGAYKNPDLLTVEAKRIGSLGDYMDQRPVSIRLDMPYTP